VAVHTREIYQSANGDRWYLVCDHETGQVYVKHQANIPSGGQTTHIEIGAFLSRGGKSPEHVALLRLIGTLTDGTGDA
jgi:hypothetical protein